ncbi:MAG: helix-turn-helix domain-containing protein [Terracidiphilus sp.]
MSSYGNQRIDTEVTVVMKERYLTEIQVAERTHISLATLRRWRLENRGPKYRKFGSLVRYDEDELNRWEEAQPFGGDAPDQRIAPRSVNGAALLRRAG